MPLPEKDPLRQWFLSFQPIALQTDLWEKIKYPFAQLGNYVYEFEDQYVEPSPTQLLSTQKSIEAIVSEFLLTKELGALSKSENKIIEQLVALDHIMMDKKIKSKPIVVTTAQIDKLKKQFESSKKAQANAIYGQTHSESQLKATYLEAKILHDKEIETLRDIEDELDSTDNNRAAQPYLKAERNQRLQAILLKIPNEQAEIIRDLEDALLRGDLQPGTKRYLQDERDELLLSAYSPSNIIENALNKLAKTEAELNSPVLKKDRKNFLKQKLTAQKKQLLIEPLKSMAKAYKTHSLRQQKLEALDESTAEKAMALKDAQKIQALTKAKAKYTEKPTSQPILSFLRKKDGTKTTKLQTIKASISRKKPS